MKNFHDLHFLGFYNHYILGDRSESFAPCFDELLYLVKLLNRWHAHECVCKRMNTDLSVVKLGESTCADFALLCDEFNQVVDWGGILAVGN